jgi:putative ABC transport system permease protein
MLRATLKSMLSRKLRLLLSTVAVVLGVMFVSGALVLTDTLGRSFDGLFTDIYEYTDIEVSKQGDLPTMQGQPTQLNIPAADVPRVAGVDGVAKATGQVFAEGARALGKNGKVVVSQAPRFGANWIGETELINLREGRGPASDGEIAISANLAKTTGYGVGDQMAVLTKEPGKRTFTIVGITGYEGGRDSLAGETTIFFTEPVAQQLMLGETAVFNVIDVRVDDGASLTDVRDRIAGVLGADYDVRTGEELAADSAEGIKQAFTFFSYILIGFAGIALFVGIFLILNTFSIVVAQRTRELALFRAMGSSRGQVIGAVLVEAVVVGLIASIIGLALGIGIGALLGSVLGGALSGGQLELASLGVPPAAIIAAFAVGIGVTVIAALLPAIRASRIPPVAAMRDSTVPDRPLTLMTIAGAVVLAIGGTALGLGLTGNLGDADLWGVLGGLITAFIGVALLTPIVSRPVVSLLGSAFGSNASGKLGRRNSARNPRRTAITAAALMVSIAIVTGISVVFGSLQESTEVAVSEGVDAELVMSADPLSGALATIDPATVDKVRELPDVDSVVGVAADIAKVDNGDEFLTGLDDVDAATSIFIMETVSGSLRLRPGVVAIDDASAADRHLSLGSTVQVETAKGGGNTVTVGGIYKRTALISGFLFGPDDTEAMFTEPAPIQAFARLTDGADTAAVRAQVDALLADDPEIAVSTLDDLVAQQAQIFNFVLIFVQLLLGLAMIIAVLGIINTLALSMIERTRELGLLRSVGMKRGQVMWMVTVESTVISVFGALLGIVVGAGLGAAVFQALRSEGFTELAFPWFLMAAYLVASVFVGLAAGLIPAIRAARLDVLKAIAYE